MTFVSIVTIASSLFLMGLIALSLINIQMLLRDAGGQADVAVYLRDESVEGPDGSILFLRVSRQCPR